MLTPCLVSCIIFYYRTAVPSFSPTSSYQPSEVPTYRPSRSPTIKNSHYFTACGSTAQWCSGLVDSSANEELHAVRCCADSKINDAWIRHSNCAAAGLDVWSKSEINGVCHSFKTFVEAENVCHQIKGARLCTREELEADCSRNSGCSFDGKVVWSSTASSAPPTLSPTKNPTVSCIMSSLFIWKIIIILSYCSILFYWYNFFGTLTIDVTINYPDIKPFGKTLSQMFHLPSYPYISYWLTSALFLSPSLF